MVHCFRKILFGFPSIPSNGWYIKRKKHVWEVLFKWIMFSLVGENIIVARGSGVVALDTHLARGTSSIKPPSQRPFGWITSLLELGNIQWSLRAPGRQRTGKVQSLTTDVLRYMNHLPSNFPIHLYSQKNSQKSHAMKGWGTHSTTSLFRETKIWHLVSAITCALNLLLFLLLR